MVSDTNADDWLKHKRYTIIHRDIKDYIILVSQLLCKQAILRGILSLLFLALFILFTFCVNKYIALLFTPLMVICAELSVRYIQIANKLVDTPCRETLLSVSPKIIKSDAKIKVILDLFSNNIESVSEAVFVNNKILFADSKNNVYTIKCRVDTFTSVTGLDDTIDFCKFKITDKSKGDV